MRVLMPHRLDVLGHAMDTNLVSQWLALEAACEFVMWGPGLEGFIPGMPLDEVAEYVDADVVFLPDLHHAIPTLWTELWAGAERCRRPVVWHLCDEGSAIDRRRAIWEHIRPAAILLNCSESTLETYGYGDLRARFGTKVLVVRLGFDAVQFHPPERGQGRDVDVLVVGCDEPVEAYPARNRIKRAARRLGDGFRVLDLAHPGYWETEGVPRGRGQAQFADLLRRSRLVTTGSGYAGLTRKYWEAAGCGTIGIGDLPAGQPDRARFTDAMLVVEEDWDEQRIAQEIRGLLSDAERCETLSLRASAAVRGCDHLERAHDYVAAFERVALEASRPRRPRPFQPPARIRKVCVAADPGNVPSVRPDWIDAWGHGEPGLSRTRCVERALAGTEDVVVLAFDPDATINGDALLLASACRQNGRVVLRAGNEPFGDVLTADWAAVAAPRAALEQALGRFGGHAGVEAALLALGGEIGWQILPGGGVYTDPASTLARLSQAPAPSLAERALARATAEHRFLTTMELAGLLAACDRGAPALVAAADPSAHATVQPENPEFELVEGGAFVRFDPRDGTILAAIARYARSGPGAPPLYIGVPLAAGISVTEVLSLLAAGLTEGGIDLDNTPDLVLLDRPLFEAEIAWLRTALADVEQAAHDPIAA